MTESCSITRRHGMILRNSTKPRTSSWMLLPAEIRLMILGAITHQKHRGWASLASVCKEWQLFIEKRNLYRLRLQVSCLDEFQHMIIRQRELVHHIQLDIELRKYTCRCCQWTESASWTSSNNSIVRDGIWKLFSILSTWKPANALVLELNAYSPSDSQHWFKDSLFASDNEDHDGAATSLRGVGGIGSRWHDPKHGWINGQRVATPPELAIMRLFETISLHFRVREELPQVDAVTCFIIRRQLRRSLHPQTLRLILDKLCRLEHMIYQPWRAWYRWERETIDQGFLLLVQSHLPKTLKRLSVFEEFSDDLATALANGPVFHGSLQVEATRIVDPRIGAAFAIRSLDLEQLSLSYMVNAEDFFHACVSTWTWQHLRSLALTSQLLRRAGSRHETDALLHQAGLTALRMPRLQTLVLWDGGKGNACAFIYHTVRDDACITWRGTWVLELSPRVVEVWERVAFENRSWALRVCKQHIGGVVVRSHGDAIHHLNLPCQVVAPASLWQIRREGA